MEAAIVVTYRCNAKCIMCNTWKNPSKGSEELSISTLNKLPHLDFCNITGGEPFLRDDIADIIAILREKSKRIVISTNGYFTEKILDTLRKFKDVGVRISLEGFPATNDKLRGIKDGFDHGLRTLIELHSLGIKDIGFGITVSDHNALDLIELYRLSEAMNLEFATAVTHNSYYFHKSDNIIENKSEVIACFNELIEALLKTKRPKNWFRAYFNHGLINYINGNVRLLPCEAGSENFFVLPTGDVAPCNGSDEPMVMGNLNDSDWEQIWNGTKAEDIRRQVRDCKKNCWMIGSAAPVMKKYIHKPLKWVAANKLSNF
jgi:MoaA/NifB/PqqE/SkfB family radical SAM enzyme